jgi:hypothetical protein
MDELPQGLLRQNQELRQQGLGIENLEMRQGNVEPKNNVLMEQTHFLQAVAVLLKALFKKGMEPIPEKNIRSGVSIYKPKANGTSCYFDMLYYLLFGVTCSHCCISIPTTIGNAFSRNY